jgi:hypothetical protein
MIEFLGALLPSAGVLFLFVIAMRSLLQADRRERSAQARLTPRKSQSPGADSSAVSSDGASIDHEERPAP